ncbi:MAG: 30S ribosomal protein S18 [Patescibacteria group bacterium]
MPYYKKEPREIVRGPKKCMICKAKVQEVDYKNVALLQRYLNRWNQIESAARTGNCARHQRQTTLAIKHARHLALLPFVTE